MKISEVIKQLQGIQDERGDIDVMFRDGDSDGVWEVAAVRWKVASENEYPEDWNMPEGTEFVLVTN